MVFYFSSAELAAYIFPADGEKPDGTIIMNAEDLKGTKDEKCAIRYIFSGNTWNNLLHNKIAFTSRKDYGREEREAQWVLAQRTLHGLQAPETSNIFYKKSRYRELSEMAEQAKRRAEIARLRELHTLKGHVESVMKLKGLDIDTIQQHYTL